MQKLLLMAVILIAWCSAAAQTTAVGKPKQFMFIIRYRTDSPSPNADLVKINGQHWGEFIAALTQGGKLVTGLRPADDGITITGAGKVEHQGAHTANNEKISSFFLVQAADMTEAMELARKCPIYELGGSVEIRQVMNTAN